MVNFGKKLAANQIPEWKDYYINYKLMKKKVRQYAEQIQSHRKNRRQVLKEFSRMLDDQIEKTVLFLLEQQGIFASKIRKLGEKRSILLEHPDISQISELREQYSALGHDLLKLLRFVDLNATGIRKILKKFDKRFGYRFTDYYLTSRANHPYSQLQQVFKHVGIGAVVGALSRNLAELQHREGSYLSIYDEPSAIPQDPIIDQIKASVDKLTHSTNFLEFLGQHALIAQEDTTGLVDDQVDKKYHFMSLLLNLANTFLYMVNTYIIVPTADDYSLSLGAAATMCGVIIGSMAVAQVFSSVYFSAWSNRSYFQPLVFSSIMLFMGNTLYAMAYDLDSLTVLIVGRLLCGLGSARAVNRRYISDCVPQKIRMQASAGFVSASALGMACGPALAGLLQTNFKIHGITINQNTLPGWVMALAWCFYLIWLWISFKEPVHDTVEIQVPQETAVGHIDSRQLEGGLAQPLLLNSEEKKTEDVDEEDDSEEASEDSRLPANSIASAYRLLTPSVKVQLLIYFMLKYAMEILLSESSVITTYYFKWTTSSVAIFLAILGLTVLPVNAIVGTYITNMFEDRQILLASEVMVLIGIILSFHITKSYTVPQYVCSALITFVSAEVLEGVNLALLSEVMSSRLARGKKQRERERGQEMGACVVNSSIAASSQRFAGDFLRGPTARTRRRSIDVLFLRPKNQNLISKITHTNRQRKKVVVSVAAGDVVDEISDPAGQPKQQHQDALSTSELDEERAGSTNAISIDRGGVLSSPSSSSSHQLDLDLDLDLKVEGGEDFDKMADRALNAAIVLAAGSFAITKLLTIDRDYWHGWTIYEILRYAPQHNWIAYEEALKANPVLAKMMISGVVYSVGDWIAQCYEGKPLFDFDRIRTFRSGLVGFTLHGSLSHYYYYFCEALFPFQDWWVVPAKVVFDQTVWSAIWNSIYFVVLGFLRLESPFNIFRELKATFWPMLTAGWKLWPFAHLITYGVIPVEQRLLWVDCVELVWVTILSTYSNEKSEARHLEAASESDPRSPKE